MASENFSHVTLIAIEAALQAGDLLRHGFGTKLTIKNKAGVQNLVTQYDHSSEKSIIEYLSCHFPSSQFLAEESGKIGSKKAELLWIIDPLDGTVNFAHRIPVFAVSIALQKEGSLLCGVIYQPIMQELFVAELGRGAYLNGQRIHVSKAKTLDQAFLSSGFPYNLRDNPFHCIEHFTAILRKGLPVRRLGSAAIDLAYTAAGRFDGFFETGLSPWDFAAGNLLIQEAGGIVTDWNGKPFELFESKTLLASNGIIHPQITKIMKTV